MGIGFEHAFEERCVLGQHLARRVEATAERGGDEGGKLVAVGQRGKVGNAGDEIEALDAGGGLVMFVGGGTEGHTAHVGEHALDERHVRFVGRIAGGYGHAQVLRRITSGRHRAEQRMGAHHGASVVALHDLHGAHLD